MTRDGRGSDGVPALGDRRSAWETPGEPAGRARFDARGRGGRERRQPEGIVGLQSLTKSSGIREDRRCQH